MSKIFENEYGFSVAENNPFLIFPYLQKIVGDYFSAGEVVDLSRGDPGLGYCPAARSRAFFGFLAVLDTALNSNVDGFRLHLQTEADWPAVEQRIADCAHTNFTPNVAAEHLTTLAEVVAKIQKYAAEEGQQLSKLAVLNGIFHHSAVLGGTYHAPLGEPLVRTVVAGYYRELLADPTLRADDFIFTLGVNDAIGTLFQMLGEEGLGFLKHGDTVAASTPAYAPYFLEISARHLDVLDVPALPADSEAAFERLENFTGRIKAFFLITPNNPTGAKYSADQLTRLAQLAERHDALIITDEIYAQFYRQFDSAWTAAQKRTIRLCGRSKIERSPGLRFGDVLITPAANAYLSQQLSHLLTAPDFKSQFAAAKAPGGMYGSFQHTAAVPGPSQFLGMLHILLGAEEREKYVDKVENAMRVFFAELGMPYDGAMYYGLFDLNAVPGCVKQAVGIDQKLYELTTKFGVILIPALKFFSAREQAASDKSNFVRVALPNLTLAQTVEAARRIRSYLTTH